MPAIDQVEYWNSAVGDTWARMQERLDAAFTPVTAALLSLAAPKPGEDVLDIGCGSGETTLALAAAVADEGSATGLDISEALLARARARAEAGLSDALFLNADAATFTDDAGFDLVVSRFGVMFFDDPVAAFANIHRLTVPGGRLCFACWQSPLQNLWATLPMQVLADLLPPQPAADPHAPGPFAFSDPEHVHGILAEAGWQDIVFHAVDFRMSIGDGDDSVASAVHFTLRIGPAARLVREAGPEVEAQAKAALAAAMAPYLELGSVGLPGAVWLVSARA